MVKVQLAEQVYGKVRIKALMIGVNWTSDDLGKFL